MVAIETITLSNFLCAHLMKGCIWPDECAIQLGKPIRWDDSTAYPVVHEHGSARDVVSLVAHEEMITSRIIPYITSTGHVTRHTLFNCIYLLCFTLAYSTVVCIGPRFSPVYSEVLITHCRFSWKLLPGVPPEERDKNHRLGNLEEKVQKREKEIRADELWLEGYF